MDLTINIDKYLENNRIKIDNNVFQKMVFILNALDDGWSVKKSNNSFIFKKNHEGKKEIFHDDYLETFLKANFDINNDFVGTK
jgi:hypothetical protein